MQRAARRLAWPTVVALLLCVNAPAFAADAFLPCPFPGFDSSLQRFSTVLTFPTVSSVSEQHHVVDPSAFEALDAFLQKAYPTVWARLKVEKLGEGDYSYLLTWQGSNPGLKPAQFISHVDVVPVSPGTEQDWTHPPFSGAIADGYVWGRGTLDVKVGVVGLLEAATALLDVGYAPERTLLLAFGHDEESGGAAGAAHIAAKLTAEGRQLEFIWDEGGVIYADGVPPLTHLPIAVVATAEKFYQEVDVTLHSSGGHSSMPPIDGSSIGARLGSFLSSMTAAPPPPRLVSPTKDLLQGLVELSSPWLAILLKVLPSAWLDRLVAGAMAGASATLAALVRDTAAVTLLQSGTAENVLPQTAQLSVNFRLLPGTPTSDTLAHIDKWLGPNAAHANATLRPASLPPGFVTDSKGAPFKLVAQAVQEGWRFSQAAGARHEGSGVPVLPYLMPGGTDSKHYQHLTGAILRISPYSLTQEQLKTVHGTNERIAVPDFQRLLCTYRAGLRLAGGGQPGGHADDAGTVMA